MVVECLICQINVLIRCDQFFSHSRSNNILNDTSSFFPHKYSGITEKMFCHRVVLITKQRVCYNGTEMFDANPEHWRRLAHCPNCRGNRLCRRRSQNSLTVGRTVMTSPVDLSDEGYSYQNHCLDQEIRIVSISCCQRVRLC